jgi:hypothetical protein
MSTDEQELTWKINNVREEIDLDLKKLASKDLPANQRRVIIEHLQMCNSSLKDLVDRNRASQKAKLDR